MTDRPSDHSPSPSAADPGRPGHVPFASLGLSPELLRAVAQLGFEETSPIQAAAIPLIMSGRDVVGQSETGSGKTAAFCIPAVERVDPAARATQVLILTPTRELPPRSPTRCTSWPRSAAACTPWRSTAVPRTTGSSPN